MPVNYTVANFFTNPQVLLLMTIGTSFTPLKLIPLRFSGALIGKGAGNAVDLSNGLGSKANGASAGK